MSGAFKNYRFFWGGPHIGVWVGTPLLMERTLCVSASKLNMRFMTPGVTRKPQGSQGTES